MVRPLHVALALLLLSSAPLAWAQTLSPAIDSATLPVVSQVPPAQLPAVQLPTAEPATTIPAATPPNTPPAAAPAAPPVAAPAAPAAPPAAAPATASDTTLLPAIPAESPASVVVPVPVDEGFSYGDVPYSLLYDAEQIQFMKRALMTSETLRRNGGTGTLEVVDPSLPQAAPAVVDPASYPVFTLGSIAYRNPRDWTVWIGDLRITPRTNNQAIRVVSVRPELVQFLWAPEYAAALKQRAQENKFADTAPVQHKITTPNRAVFDAQAGQVLFSLKPNQSFVAGYMATFEGTPPNPALAALTPPSAENGALPQALTDGGVDPATGAPTEEKEQLADEAIQRLYKQAGGERPTEPATVGTLLQTSPAQTPASTTPPSTPQAP